jgi:hypothetical protein
MFESKHAAETRRVKVPGVWLSTLLGMADHREVIYVWEHADEIQDIA